MLNVRGNVREEETVISGDECGGRTHQASVSRDITKERIRRNITRLFASKCSNLVSTRITK